MDLIPPEIAAAPVVSNLYDHTIRSRKVPDGLHMEFGVATGRSLRQLRALIPKDVRLYGFDSFEGIPEPWDRFPAGAFATHIRLTLPNTELVIGLYQDTLADFVKRCPQPVSFMHIDCDLYSSTMAIFNAFKNQIVPGTIILFDELFGYAGYEKYEYRALQECGLKYECLARWDCYRAAIKVVE